MAKKNNTPARPAEKTIRISPETKIDVYKFCGDKVQKKEMTVAEYEKLQKIAGWRYQAYESGFCSIPITE